MPKRIVKETDPQPGIAAFDVGDLALLHKPGYEVHLTQVTITGGYAFHSVKESDGTSTKRWGYLGRLNGDAKTYVFFASELREYAHKPFHVRLVVDNTQAVS